MFDFIKVRMVGVTVPTIEEIPDSEGLVSYTARVSNEGNQTNFETAAGLLRYCMRENHVSVFEMANIVMEIEAPRDIARQILRHRSFSFQEFSQRYSEATKFTTRECRLQDEKNRQNSILTEDWMLIDYWETAQEEVLELIKFHYEKALMLGVAKEVARCILPEGLTMSKMYMNGTVRSWIHYCQLREKNGTQLEHQDVAVKAKQEILSKFPFLAEVMEK
ncbi:MAG: FAD-dependent thymidylate synthase [Myoviridae sp. ctThM1]|nr:MAG: FAD-dependent thymidylate synthase [Myoviridae sp. ctThM1]